MKSYKTQITRLITNQLIIGKTTPNTSANTYIIEQPFEVIPTVDGVQMIPLDAHILGKEIQVIEVSKNNTLYSNECSQELQNTYLKTISGIETDDKKLII